MKKILCVLLLLSVLLCACGGNGETVTQASVAPATQTSAAPTTQATEVTETVPETTTEPLSECEKNGHTWVEANYQEPKTCSVCGETEGEPLTPDFETYNLPINMTDADTEYDYITTCSENPDAKTVGKCKITDYCVFEGDEAHQALDGYEWHKVSFDVLFSDDNAWKWGVSTSFFLDDYYQMRPQKAESYVDNFAVNFHGVEYTECIGNLSGSFSQWKDRQITLTLEFYVRVPVGYDGAVVGINDGGPQVQDGQYIYEFVDENTLYFRCDGNVSK